MGKYEKFNDTVDVNSDIIGSDENVIYDLKPKKNLFIFNKIIVIIPVVIINFIFDMYLIISVINNDFFSNTLLVILGFVVCRGVVVYLWFKNILNKNKKWLTTRYIVTDKRIIIKNGLVHREYRYIYYKDIVDIHLKVSFFDKIFKVGNIYFDVLGSISDGNSDTVFLDVLDSRNIYDALKTAVDGIRSVNVQNKIFYSFFYILFFLLYFSVIMFIVF